MKTAQTDPVALSQHTLVKVQHLQVDAIVAVEEKVLVELQAQYLAPGDVMLRVFERELAL